MGDCCGLSGSDVTPDALEGRQAQLAPLDMEEIARLREQMRREDAERRHLAEEKERERDLTESEAGIRGIERLGAVRVAIGEEAEVAWAGLFGDDDALSPARVVNLLTQNSPLEFTDNLSIQVLRIPNGVIFNMNCKQSGAPPDEQASWLREHCQMSLSRKITREHGRLVMVDERTDMRGGGCKQLYRQLLPLYEAMGVTNVSLSADEVGSYAWVRYGFRPSAEGWLELRTSITARLEQRRGQLDAETYQAVLAILAKADPNAIEEIANLNIDVPSGDGGGATAKLGFLLLQKNMWEGVLDLTNAETVGKLRAYIA